MDYILIARNVGLNIPLYTGTQNRVEKYTRNPKGNSTKQKRVKFQNAKPSRNTNPQKKANYRQRNIAKQSNIK